MGEPEMGVAVLTCVLENTLLWNQRNQHHSLCCLFSFGGGGPILSLIPKWIYQLGSRMLRESPGQLRPAPPKTHLGRIVSPHCEKGNKTGLPSDPLKV